MSDKWSTWTWHAWARFYFSMVFTLAFPHWLENVFRHGRNFSRGVEANKSRSCWLWLNYGVLSECWTSWSYRALGFIIGLQFKCSLKAKLPMIRALSKQFLLRTRARRSSVCNSDGWTFCRFCAAGGPPSSNCNCSASECMQHGSALESSVQTRMKSLKDQAKQRCCFIKCQFKAKYFMKFTRLLLEDGETVVFQASFGG